MSKEDAPGQNKDIEVIINGSQETLNGKETSFLELVKVAFGISELPPNTVYTISFSKGEEGKQGTLVEGDTVKLKKGMIFNVSGTDKS